MLKLVFNSRPRVPPPLRPTRFGARSCGSSPRPRPALPDLPASGEFVGAVVLQSAPRCRLLRRKVRAGVTRKVRAPYALLAPSDCWSGANVSVSGSCPWEGCRVARQRRCWQSLAARYFPRGSVGGHAWFCLAPGVEPHRCGDDQQVWK